VTFPPRFIDPAQEHLYRETLSRRFRINARVGTTLTLVCTLGFTLFNRFRSVGVFDAELIARLDVVRFGVLLPLLIACCAGSFVASLERFNRLMAWGSLLACMLVLGWVLVHVPEASRPPLRDAMLMVLLFLPLYELGLLLSVAAIAAIASTALWALGEVNHDVWKAAPVVTITAFVGVMVAWVIELRARRDFATLQSVRDASASLASTNVRLAQLLAERQRQLRSAAHDLRSPLTSILVNSEVLGTEPRTG
jgi:signal transduction histidine kinase